MQGFGEHNKTTLVYACKIGDADYMEEILFQQDGYVNKDELLQKATAWAKNNGYDRVRVHVIDLNTPPNFG